MKHLLKNFKKVSSDGNSTTFKNKDGHEIKIAHKALSKQMKKEVEDLPNFDDGGMVQPIYDDSVNNGYDLYHQNDPQSQNFDRSPASVSSDDRDASISKLKMSPDEMAAIDNAPPAPAGQVGFHNSDAPQGAPPDSPPQGAWQLPLQAPQHEEAAPSPAPVPYQGLAQTNGTGIPDAFSAGARTELSSLRKGMQGYNEGEQKEASAIKMAGDVAASEAMVRQQASMDMQKHYEAAHNELNQHRQALIQDIQNGHIDPSHYMETRNSGQKIATAIGLILGGISSGVTGQANPAMEFLNKQIDRDIEAQKLDLGKKENLLSANLKATGDLNDATNLTRVNLADAYSAALQRQAAQLQGPLAQARAQQAAGQLQMKVAPELGQLTQKMAVGKMLQGMQGQNIQPERKIQLYKITGILSDQDANKAYESLDSYRNAENIKNNILTAAQKIANEQTMANRLGRPFDSTQQIENLKTEVGVQALKKMGARPSPELIDKLGSTLTAGITSGKDTSKQMQSTLSNIFGQQENESFLRSYGLLPSGNQAFGSQGQSNFPGTKVK